MQPKINDELKKIIPPLSPAEYKQLEQNCITNGIQDTIKLWAGYIVDGHNRFQIAQDNNLKYDVETLKFNTIEDVKIWMIDNQNGRRNLTDGWKYELKQTKKKLLKAKGKENMSVGGSATKEGLSIVDKPLYDKHNTQKEIANDLNWSVGKVATADKVWKHADKKTKEEIKAGEKTFNQVYNEIKKAEKEKKRADEIKQTKEKIKKENIEIKEKYDAVILDPPWSYDSTTYDADSQRGVIDYPTQTEDQIYDTCKNFFKDDCSLWLWTTHKFIWQAKSLMDRFGFEYKCILTWDKVKMGIGRNLRLQTEFCLVGKKGKPVWELSDQRDIITSPRREHSRKPDEFYELVKSITHGTIFEFYSREPKDGIITAGYENDKF